MSQKNELQSNNVDLQDILDAVNALPDRGAPSGGNTDIEDALVTRTLTEYENSRVTSIGSCAFYGFSSLTSVAFSNVQTVGDSAFANCTELTTINFPQATTISYYAFQDCHSLVEASFPKAENIYSGAFSDCVGIKVISFQKAKKINGYPFQKCVKLSSLTINASAVCTLQYSRAFSSTPYTGYSTHFKAIPYIYVPASLLTSYQTATNWAYFSSYFTTIEDKMVKFVYSTTSGNYTYDFKLGMTWKEWVESDYNVDGFTVDGNTVYDMDKKVVTENEDGVSGSVNSNDIIYPKYYELNLWDWE